MTYKDISASLLNNILQIGQLDYGKIMFLLKDATYSNIGQFFEKSQTGENFICRYTDTNQYILDQKYTFQELPINQYTIFYRNKVIAIICLDNIDNLESQKDTIQQGIHDSICIGLVMGHLKESKYTFTISVCNALSNIVQQVIDMFESTASRLRADKRYVEINSYLNDIMKIIFDTIDYLEIDSENIELEKNIVDMTSFMRELTKTFEVIFGKKIVVDMDDSAAGIFVFDQKKVNQMLMILLKKLVTINNIQIRVMVSDVVLTFIVYSSSPKGNQEILRILEETKITVANLDIFIVKRLCEIMSGTFKVENRGAFVSISVGKTTGRSSII
jgi:hypothetical protein